MVSVIIPVYNVEEVLRYCLNSVLSQNLNEYELILIDDGSQDRSGLICDEYAKKDQRIKSIHQDNRGVSEARNIGISLAKGDHICFIDSDDYVDPDYLESLIALKDRFPDCDNVWGSFLLEKNYDHHPNSEALHENANRYSAAQIMTLHQMWLDAGTVCKLYDTQLIRKHLIRFDPALSLGEDLKFNYEYLDHTNGHIAVSFRPTYHYVKNSTKSLSQKYYKNMFDIYKDLNQMMCTYMKKWGCDQEQFGILYSTAFYKYEVVLKNTFHQDDPHSIREKYRINHEIMTSKEFKTALEKMSATIHPLYKLAYQSGSYRAVQFLDRLVTFVKRV